MPKLEAKKGDFAKIWQKLGGEGEGEQPPGHAFQIIIILFDRLSVIRHDGKVKAGAYNCADHCTSHPFTCLANHYLKCSFQPVSFTCQKFMSFARPSNFHKVKSCMYMWGRTYLRFQNDVLMKRQHDLCQVYGFSNGISIGAK